MALNGQKVENNSEVLVFDYFIKYLLKLQGLL